MSDLTTWIKSQLTKHGKKQIDLARKLKLPAPRISEAMKDQRKFTPEEIERILDFFGHNVPWRHAHPSHKSNAA